MQAEAEEEAGGAGGESNALFVGFGEAGAVNVGFGASDGAGERCLVVFLGRTSAVRDDGARAGTSMAKVEIRRGGARGARGCS
jgi:hypothetical protein